MFSLIFEETEELFAGDLRHHIAYSARSGNWK